MSNTIQPGLVTGPPQLVSVNTYLALLEAAMTLLQAPQGAPAHTQAIQAIIEHHRDFERQTGVKLTLQL